MALAYALGNRIWQTSTTQTTGGTITLSAAAQTIIVDGVTHVYRRFRDEFADGAKVALYLTVESSGEYEYSRGTLVYGTAGGPDTIQSRTVTRSDGGIGVAKAWGAGTRNAQCAVDPLELLLRANLLEEIALLGTAQQSTARTNLGATAGLWTHSTVDHGTTALKLVRLDAAGKLPAVDGSQLTNLPAGPSSPIPTGTVMLFYQPAAPSGWTRVTNVSDNIVNIVSAGSPGTKVDNAWFITGFTVQGTALTVAQLPPHVHSINQYDATGVLSAAAAGGGNFLGTFNTGSGLGTSATHTHGIVHDGNWRPPVAYCLLASKN